MQKNVRKPKDFHMPHSKALAARCGEDEDGRYIQISSAGTREPKTARRLGKWLLRAEWWVANPRKRQ